MIHCAVRRLFQGQRARATNVKIGPVDLFKNENGCVFLISTLQMDHSEFHFHSYDTILKLFLAL